MKKIVASLLFLIVWLSGCTMVNPDLASDGSRDTRSAISPSSLASLREGLILELLFDSDLLDSSGEGNDGTPKGEPGPSFVAGLRDEALEIDDRNLYEADDAHVKIYDSDSIDLSQSDFSLSYWYKYNKSDDSIYGQSVVFSLQDASYSSDPRTIPGTPLVELHHFTDDDNEIMNRFIMTSPDGGTTIDSFFDFYMTRYQWHHVVLTVDWDNSEGVKFYFDTVRNPQTFDPTVIGRDYPATLNLLLGGSVVCITDSEPVQYDNLRVYNRLLTENEIDELYDFDSDDATVMEDNNFSYVKGSSSTGYTYTESGPEGHDLDCIGNIQDIMEPGGYLSLDEGDDVYLEGSASGFDIGKEDFDIRILLRTSSDESITVFDKREDGSGYHMQLVAGKYPLLQLASNGTWKNYISYSTPPVNDGEWHDIRYEIRRQEPYGLKLYIDDVEVAFFDARTFSNLSLSNNASFLLGKHSSLDIPFVGDISTLHIMTY